MSFDLLKLITGKFFVKPPKKERRVTDMPFKGPERRKDAVKKASQELKNELNQTIQTFKNSQTFGAAMQSVSNTVAGKQK